MQIVESGFRCSWIATAVWVVMAMPASAAQLVDPGVGDAYPLAKCIVGEIMLDEDAVVFTDQGREFRVCCEQCMDGFFQDVYQWVTLIDTDIIQQQLPYYPLKKCIVNGKPLGSDALNYVFRNRLFRLCSDDCREKLKSKPSKFFGELNRAVIQKQKANYPLTTCIVSGVPLDDNAFDHVVANQLVRLADVDQLDKFNRTPGKYLLKLQAAAKEKAEQKKAKQK